MLQGDNFNNGYIRADGNNSSSSKSLYLGYGTTNKVTINSSGLSVYSSVNPGYSTFTVDNGGNTVISTNNSGTNSIWDSVGNSVTNPINDLARWMIAL